jgi:hypothetical protein
MPQIEGSHVRWRLGEAILEVDAAQGARVTAFRIGDEDILLGPAINALNFGSTFWTSPQSQWGWPPPPEIDSVPYQISLSEGAVSFAGPPSRALGLAVTKTFSVDAGREAAVIRYAIQNRADEPRTVAPWEISRHRTGGLTFFPTGDGVEPPSTLAVHQAEGATWFSYHAPSITDHQKLFAHGAEGWIAHLDVARRMLLVKTFPEITRADQAPGEAQIELYADPDHTYIEVEEQGPYRQIAPGEEAAWTVTWRLRRVTPATAIHAGSRDLLGLARGLARAGGS